MHFKGTEDANLILPDDVSDISVKCYEPQSWPLFPGLQRGQDRDHRGEAGPGRQQRHEAVRGVRELRRGECSGQQRVAHTDLGPRAQAGEVRGQGPGLGIDLHQELEAGARKAAAWGQLGDGCVAAHDLRVLDHGAQLHVVSGRHVLVTRGGRRQDQVDGVVGHVARGGHGPRPICYGDILKRYCQGTKAVRGSVHLSVPTPQVPVQRGAECPPPLAALLRQVDLYLAAGGAHPHRGGLGPHGLGQLEVDQEQLVVREVGLHSHHASIKVYYHIVFRQTFPERETDQMLHLFFFL